MLHSLRARLMATMAGVVLASLGLLAFASSRAGRSQFHRLEEVLVLRTPDGNVETRKFEAGPGPPAGRERTIASSFNRTILLAAGGCGAVALLLTGILVQRIFGPIQILTRAVRRMEGGDLRHRVDLGSRDEVGELAAAFNAMADSLERNDELRRRLVSDVAHELRTPLTNLKAQIEAIEDGLLEPSPAAIASLREDSEALHRVVEDLQDLALAEARALRMEVSPVDLSGAVERTLEAFRSRAVAGEVCLESSIPPGFPPVAADERRLVQILRNLVENALVHTPGGGKVSLAATVLGSSAEITVRDTGSGISPEDLPRVFERFYRADPSRSRSSGGTGLGLPIVRELVRAGGGEVSARSEVGRGTLISFSVPFMRNS